MNVLRDALGQPTLATVDRPPDLAVTVDFAPPSRRDPGWSLRSPQLALFHPGKRACGQAQHLFGRLLGQKVTCPLDGLYPQVRRCLGS